MALNTRIWYLIVTVVTEVHVKSHGFGMFLEFLAFLNALWSSEHFACGEMQVRRKVINEIHYSELSM